MVRVPGGSVRVQVDGPDGAPALVLAHSLAAHLGMWDEQVPVWARRYRVVRYDVRGHGGSTAPGGGCSIGELAGDAMAVMDALGLARAHWCGLSLGGMIGLWLLRHAPGRIDRAVLAHLAARLGPPELWDGRIRTAARSGIEPLVEPTLRYWFDEAFMARFPERADAMRRMIRATSIAGYQACCAAIRDMDQRDGLARIDRPVLVIAGRRDRATAPADGAAIAGAIPGASFAMRDTAHFGPVEQPRAFADTVETFLGRATVATGRG
jgi:3-oxoadipate enol-lactonase